MKPIRYKGYTGLADIDTSANLIRGKVINTKDTITFQGKTVREAVAAFREAVDTYLEFCAEIGVAPEKPYSGRVLLRISPSLHRDLSLLAQTKGQSVNSLVEEYLTRIAGETQPAGHP